MADLERQHGIPPDTYCGPSPEAMSRAVPELSAEARQVIAGNYSFSHAK